ncbi:MAG: DUF2946 family protein [Burkholderiaceae bacterium]|nr:DUF2946 family protein [Burkholderiaceae bacterium]
MDEIVRQAMTKWPNVPHCYGWLALDARGAFRMRDEAAQAAGAAGDVIRHPALLSFIYRNYLRDERSAWYFQNGPQRVYVELEATPFVARTDPGQGFVTHDGAPFAPIEAGWITRDGRLLLEGAGKVAMVDDRDLAECLPLLRRDGQALDDARLLDWLEAMQEELQLQLDGSRVAVRPLRAASPGEQFGFVASPASLQDGR